MSILPVISIVLERLLCKQITLSINQLMSKFRCGFRKNYAAQYCLLAMSEQWKSEIDEGKVIGALLTDLSNFFDCLTHEIMIAKLSAHRFSLFARRLVQNHLPKRQQRTKINESYSSSEEILFNVPQGLILDPVFFSTFVSGFFLTVKDAKIANYADDNTIYQCR